jgi:flagellar biosynthetic protein FlhB
MADGQDSAQKTEEPSQKRIDEAEKEGQIARSLELNYWFAIGGATLVVVIFSGSIASQVARLTMPFLASADDISMDAGNLGRVLYNLFGAVGMMLVPALVLLAVATLGGTLIQHRPVISFAVLMPNFSRFQPLAKLKGIVNLRGGLEFVKGLIKLAVVGGTAVMVIMPKISALPLLVGFDPAMILVTARDIALAMLFGIIAVMAAIAGADVIYQKWRMLRDLRMSKQEVRDEARQSEGDPAVRARIRAIRNERGRKRMMAAVPEADVVVTNPTHFAVAMKYDGGVMTAPKVVAKGQDYVALRIRELAEEHKVPIVENPPLARALFASCEIDREIPTEHYRAVAEIIGYVMRLKGRTGARPAAR